MNSTVDVGLKRQSTQIKTSLKLTLQIKIQQNKPDNFLALILARIGHVYTPKLRPSLRNFVNIWDVESSRTPASLTHKQINISLTEFRTILGVRHVIKCLNVLNLSRHSLFSAAWNLLRIQKSRRLPAQISQQSLYSMQSSFSISILWQVTNKTVQMAFLHY
jgi:hypothetical protein